MAKPGSDGSLLFVQLSVAAFLFLLGLAGIVTYHHEIDRLFGARSDSFGLFVSILSIVAGVLIVVPLVVRVDSRATSAILVAVLIFWALRILFVFFFYNFSRPDFLLWLQQLSPNVVILASLWLLARRYA